MLSHGRICAPHDPQALGGEMIERLAGTRNITTLRKEPMKRPRLPMRRTGTLGAAQVADRHDGTGLGIVDRWNSKARVQIGSGDA